MLRRSSALLALLPVLIAGCGGSGGSGKTSGGAGQIYPRVNIAWPAQTRGFEAPSYATAARITFVNVDTGAHTVDTAVRPEGSAAVNQTRVLEYPIKPGDHLLRVEFLSDWSSNVPLATASVNVKVLTDGTLRTMDGKPLGTVAYDAKVTGLSLTLNRELEVGFVVGVTVTAHTANGVAALRPDIVSVAATSGNDKVTINPDNSLTGVAEGSVTLVPSIDGLIGSSATVAVRPAPTEAQVVSLDTNDFVFDPTRNLLWVATPGGDVKSVDPATGSIGTTFQVGSNPTALALSDDGSTLYAGLRAASAVRQIDLITNTLGLKFAIPDAEFGGTRYVRRIAVQPGHPSTVALTSEGSASSLGSGVAIFDDGVKRPNGLHFFTGNRMVWTATDRLVTWDGYSSDDTLRVISVDAQGATVAGSVKPV